MCLPPVGEGERAEEKRNWKMHQVNSSQIFSLFLSPPNEMYSCMACETSIRSQSFCISYNTTQGYIEQARPSMLD